MHGGSGIDQIVLDTQNDYFLPDYAAFASIEPETLDGDGSNDGVGLPSDDFSTDILLIIGTNNDDVIRLGQIPYEGTKSRLVVDYNGRSLVSNWRSFVGNADANGTPLIEQFRISGIGGNDVIEFPVTDFVSGSSLATVPLDLSELVDRKDWVSVIDGGGENDVILGTAGRDRIDGGFGDDTIYGFGGNDQLWGDGGRNQGTRRDQTFSMAAKGTMICSGDKGAIDSTHGHSILRSPGTNWVGIEFDQHCGRRQSIADYG